MVKLRRHRPACHCLFCAHCRDAVNGWGQALQQQQQQQHSGLMAPGGGGTLSGYETPASSGATPEPEGDAEGAQQAMQQAATQHVVCWSCCYAEPAVQHVIAAAGS
jgi:hypothetical protein